MAAYTVSEGGPRDARGHRLCNPLARLKPLDARTVELMRLYLQYGHRVGRKVRLCPEGQPPLF